MSLAGFDHVAVLTRDLDAFVAFYEDVFGARSERGLTEDGVRTCPRPDVTHTEVC